MEKFVESKSPIDTFRLGKQLAQGLKGGETICLYGDLGAGKTVFAKGLAHGLGVKDEITSPTFTLIQEYDSANGLKLIHMDLYRLQHPEEAEVIGVCDYFREDCVCLIEWPEIVEESLPSDRLEICFQGNGDLPRSIRLNIPREMAYVKIHL